MFGKYFADWASTLDLGMAPGAFQGFDPQSDREAAVFFNGWRLITEVSQEINQVKIPWALWGALLVNLVSCLATTAAFHPDLSPAERLENSMAAFVLLDLGDMLASDERARRNQPKGSCWLHKLTHKNLQFLCGVLAIAVCSLDVGVPFVPHRSSELLLEQFFGYLQSQYASSQMTIRDYIHASAKKMRQTSLRMKRDPPQPSHVQAHSAITDDEFAACAQKALNSAVKLMACCSDRTPGALLKAYVAYAAKLPSIPLTWILQRLEQLTLTSTRMGSPWRICRTTRRRRQALWTLHHLHQAGVKA